MRQKGFDYLNLPESWLYYNRDASFCTANLHVGREPYVEANQANGWKGYVGI